MAKTEFKIGKAHKLQENTRKKKWFQLKKKSKTSKNNKNESKQNQPKLSEPSKEEFCSIKIAISFV